MEEQEVSCMFCEQMNSAESTNVVKFTLETMRLHLIEKHAKESLTAFLFPDAGNPCHYFLGCCVKIPELEDVTVPTDNDDKIGPKHINDDENAQTVLDSLTPEMRTIFSNVLLTIKNGEATQTILSTSQYSPFDDDDGAPLRKRFKKSSKQVLDLFDNDADEDVDEEEYAKCKSCHAVVKMDLRYTHVLSDHVQRDDMFTCSVCSFSHESSQMEVKTHAETAHPGESAFAHSNELRYKTLIYQWMRRCYDNWRSIDTRLDIVVPSSASSGQKGIPDIKRIIKGTRCSPPPHIDLTNIDEKICRLCWEEVRYPGRHLLQKHLRKPLYECPVCESFGSYESCSVAKHIQKAHPQESDMSPTSNNELYKEVITDLQNICFPDRKMKLARPISGAKPRERHICGICSDEVAQSDRQRHVYHRHLKKDRIFECPFCDFASNYDIHRVKWHINWDHKDAVGNREPISHEDEYRAEITTLNAKCFPGWNRRRATDAPEVVETNEAAESSAMDCENSSNTDTESVDSEKHNKDSKKKAVDSKSADKKNSKITEKPTPKRLLRSSGKGTSALNLKIESNEDTETSSAGSSGSVESATRMSTRRQSTATTRSAIHSPTSSSKAGKKDLKPEAETAGRNSDDTICQLCDSEQRTMANLMKHLIKEHPNNSACPSCKKSCTDNCEFRRLQNEQKCKNADTNATNPSRKSRALTETPVASTPKKGPQSQKKDKNGKIITPAKVTDTTQCSRKRRHNVADSDTKVSCNECGMEMKTEDRQIHVYRHHLKEPRLYECPICDFSHHACSSDVRGHIKHAHPEHAETLPRSNLIQFSTKIAELNLLCFPGWINRRLPTTVENDFSSCRICGEEVRQTSRHIAEVHLKISLHQCPICQYGAAESRLVQRHMRNNHPKKDIKNQDPISNVIMRKAEFSQMHDMCFPGRPKRLTNITISEEGRRAKCRECGMTISRKKFVSHVLQHHVNIDCIRCPHCDFTSHYDNHEVKTHIEAHHNKSDDPVILVTKHHVEILKSINSCFPDNTLKRADLSSYSYLS